MTFIRNRKFVVVRPCWYAEDFASWANFKNWLWGFGPRQFTETDYDIY